MAVDIWTPAAENIFGFFLFLTSPGNTPEISVFVFKNFENVGSRGSKCFWLNHI